ncbi:hypothetical protein DFQ29_005858 [Apophysomyces sp. BC1021]|nr:hypothetical protein DFQ29_005858 [Apophysomyces sp. BC1021]
MSVLIIEIMVPYGYSEAHAGICASSIVIAGYFGGAAMTSYWAGKTRQYLMIVKMFTPMMAFTYILLLFGILPNAFEVALVIAIANGFLSYGLFPIELELACELAYPVPESICSAIIWSLGSATMLIFCVVIDALRAGPDATPPNNMRNSMIFVVATVFGGSLPCVWMDGRMKRQDVDNKEALISNS